MIGRAKHNKMLFELEERVKAMHPDDIYRTEWDYDRGPGKVGEIDLLRITKKGTWVQYEVKSGCFRKYKAQEQYKRFCKSFPEQNIKGVYVSPGEISRL
jgi:hypothetical protein